MALEIGYQCRESHERDMRNNKAVHRHIQLLPTIALCIVNELSKWGLGDVKARPPRRQLISQCITLQTELLLSLGTVLEGLVSARELA